MASAVAPSLAAVGLSLAGAAVYGAGDFFGGLASRKNPPATVVVLSQVAGLAVLALGLLFVPSRFYPGDIAVGAFAGIAGAVGIVALYAALAKGRMGVVSPVTAVVGASVPVVFGLVVGERPSAIALAGVALAFVAVALVSANAETRTISLREPGLPEALLSGAGIGALYVLLSRGHHDAGLGLLAITRVISIPLLLGYAAMRRETLRPSTGSLGTIALAGVFDMGANVLYLLATRVGLLAIVAVLTSLYPASTVLLARLVLHERLERLQWAGVLCAVAGVVCIAL
jgi:drug/metabolite transporter (DMT)-like permease